MTQCLGNSRFMLGILEFSASLRGSKATEAISRNSRFYLEFSTMSSSGLTGGSLFCDEILGSSRGMTQGLGILDLRCPLGFAVAASYKTPFLDTVLQLGLGF